MGCLVHLCGCGVKCVKPAFPQYGWAGGIAPKLLSIHTQLAFLIQLLNFQGDLDPMYAFFPKRSVMFFCTDASAFYCVLCLLSIECLFEASTQILHMISYL